MRARRPRHRSKPHGRDAAPPEAASAKPHIDKREVPKSVLRDTAYGLVVVHVRTMLGDDGVAQMQS
jgi:hypothetical protein